MIQFHRRKFLFRELIIFEKIDFDSWQIFSSKNKSIENQLSREFERLSESTSSLKNNIDRILRSPEVLGCS